eukprot:2714162-Rhodomonas_salina.1
MTFLWQAAVMIHAMMLGFKLMRKHPQAFIIPATYNMLVVLIIMSHTHLAFPRECEHWQDWDGCGCLWVRLGKGLWRAPRRLAVRQRARSGETLSLSTANRLSNSSLRRRPWYGYEWDRKAK